MRPLDLGRCGTQTPDDGAKPRRWGRTYEFLGQKVLGRLRQLGDLVGEWATCGDGPLEAIELPQRPRPESSLESPGGGTAGGRFWDIEWVGPGQRGESGPTVLNGSQYLIKVRSNQRPLCVAQVQLSLLDIAAVKKALETSDGAVLLDLLDEVSPDEIRRALPNLPGPARDFDLVLSQDAVARLIERARRRR